MLAGILAGALALSVSPILGFTGVASAQTEADPIGAGNFCEDVPQTEPFSDITAADPAFGHIVCLVATEITVGFPDGTYRPNSPTARRQMALFLTRLADEADRLEVGDNIEELPPYDGTPDFSDHAAEAADQEAAIGRLNQAGIASGFPDGTYRPGANVSRRQMATFIYNLYDFLTGAPLPASAEDHFSDDNSDSAAQQARTNAVAEAGIFIGNADGTFAPNAPITRRQMARVMTRTLQVLFEAGEITQWAAEGTSNQDFAVAPSAAATQSNATTRTFTVTGLGTTPVDIRLFNCANVQTTNNVTTFTGTTPASDVDTAAPGNTGGSTITVVNGVPGGSTDQVVPQNGSISFTVTGPVAADPGVCVVPVVVADAADDDDLDIGANNQPTDDFGVGGQTTFTPAAAAAGPFGPSNVTSTDKANNRFSACFITIIFVFETNGNPCATYSYDANDTFTVDGASVGLDTFEAAVSTGDDISGTFATDPGGVSNFTLIDESPSAPNVAVSQTPGAQSTSATLDITQPPSDGFNFNPRPDSYNVHRLQSADADCTDANEVFPANYTQIGTVPADPDGTTTFTATGLTPSTNYCFVVVAVDEGDVSPPSAEMPHATAATNTAETDDPDAEDTELFTSGGFPDVIDAGDVIKVCFDEALAPLSDADAEAIQISDTDAVPSVIQLTSGTNATFVLNAAPSADTDAVNGGAATPCPTGAELTITVTGAPTVVQAGTNPGVAVATASITNAADIEDPAGNLFSPTGDPDVTVNVEGAEPS